MQFNVFCDGGARGNPGPAATGFLIKDQRGKILEKTGKFLGQTTNNVAEYQAVIEALKWLSQSSVINHQSSVINFFLDSRLVVNQLNGLFKIKNGKLRELVVEIRQLEQRVGGNVSYQFIKREKNQEADQLVNQVLDQQFSS
jgi:ribonuclease HI